MSATVVNLKGISALEITGATSIAVVNGVVSLTVSSGGGTPGGSNGNLQYNNSGVFGGFADGTSHQLLHGGQTFAAVDLTADVTGILPAANVGSLPASKITSGKVGLAQGGTGVDLSATGGATFVLAQDGSQVISARALVAADIPNLAASKITTGALALARGGTGVDLSATGGSTFVLAQDASHVVSARALIAADIPSLPASQIGSGLLGLARGGTGVDLSGTGGSTFVLAQDASHVISARALIAADIPSLPASQITSGLLALARGGTAVDLSATGGTTAILAQDASHVISARNLVAADIPTLPASQIGSGLLGLARGGTNADLSASGSTTAVLAQDASHVITARALVAADIPSLAASKITTGQIALAQGGTGVDLSASGSTHGVLAQDASHVISTRQLSYSDISGSPPAPSGVFPSPTMGLMSYVYPAIGTISNFTVAGHDTSTSFGTLGGNGGGVGAYIGITMSGTTKSGYNGSLCHPANIAPYMNTMWGLGTGITNTLSWVGLTDLNGTLQLAGLVPNGNYAMFRYANGTDTNFKCITCDNSTQTVVDSGVALVANTIYKLTINVDFSNSQVLFYINGTLVATITTHLPTSSAAMSWFSGITQTSGTGNQIFIGRTFVFDQLG